MPNIPGSIGIPLPGVYTDIETLSSGTSITGGARVAALIGQGTFSQTLVSSALGGGQDGLNSTWTSTIGSDGRHFQLSNAPIISNRTQLFRNGLPLNITEGTASTFSNTFDAQVDIATGHITLQAAFLVDQGGAFWTASTLNVGVGQINNLQLLSTNTPTETWTIKCTSVQRNSSSQPIAQTASFTAFGSVSGNIRDGYGNSITWISNNVVVSNGVLSFSIQETASSPFVPGDSFTIKVKSGALIQNDSLTATYIPVANINAPVFLQTMKDVSNTFGLPSLTNNLSLGCQLAFDNSAPGILCVQAAPPLPRRTSYELVTDFPASSTDGYDFIIPFPEGVVPDINSNIHIFVTNTSTNVETQLLANKWPFYTLDTAGNPSSTNFIFSNVEAPGGWDFFYTVVSKIATVQFAQDGYMNAGNYNTAAPGVASFSSASVPFTSANVGQYIFPIDGYNQNQLNQAWIITSVSGGVATINEVGSPSPFPAFLVDNAATISWTLFNPSTGLTVAHGTHGTITSPNISNGLVSSTFTDSTFGAFNALPNGADARQLLISLNSSSLSNSPNYNIGTFEITAATSNTLTIQKSFVSESGMKFELQDPTTTSQYLVLNHNIVPQGNDLRVTIVDQRDAPFFDAGWLNALASLTTQECDIVVPLPNQTISMIFQNALDHCLSMSNINNKKERVLFIGAINGLTPSNLTGASLAAVESLGVLEGIHGNTVAEILAGDTEDLANYSVSAAYGNTFRVVYFFPDQIVVSASGNNILIDGFYQAAAAAGFFVGTGNIAMPLTNKTLTGYTILGNRMFSPFTIQQLVGAGVTVVQPVAGGGNVVWGITTTQSGFVEEQEISIVFIRDRIAKTLRTGFQAFIGQPADDSLQAKLSGRAQSLLTSFITQNLISAYADLLVVQDSVDPTQWDVSVRVQPIYPVNFIFIKVSVGLL